MAGGISSRNLKPLGDLFGAGTLVGLSDAELLCRYADSRDGSAFAALVARHGPLVAATCRAVLRNHHDVEDAFQATFLVLARRAGSIRVGDALGGWLHRVAYRVAVQRNVEVRRRRRYEAEEPDMAIPDARRPRLVFDVRSILHEEVDRLPESQRLPVILCDLEGLTYEQAAGRLRSTVPTLYHRLAKGRKRLRDRLIRRGVTAAATGAAMELSRATATAAVPAAWAQAAVAVATGGPIPAMSATLTYTLIRSLLMARIKIAAVAALAVAGLVSVGITTSGARRSHTPGPPSQASVAARTTTRVDEPKPTTKPVEGEARDLQKTPAPRRGALRVAKLKHAGDWNLAPQAIPNLMDALQKPPFSSNVIVSQKELLPRDPNLIYYPLVYLHGRGALSFPKEDFDALRRHLRPGGGTLFVDAACGDPAFDASFRRFVAALLPGHKLEPIPRDDELYTVGVGFDLSECQYNKAAGGGRGLPQLEGVKIDGHWVVIYSKVSLGCALARHSVPDCKTYIYESAVKIAGNIVIYSSRP
jgi:RNA polymerase sigma factor (sigma-70 family)